MFRHPFVSRAFRIAPTVLFGALWGALGLAQSVQQFPATSPTGITAGPDGAMWYANQSTALIGRIDMNGAVTKFPAADTPQAITTGPDGNLWYSLQPGRIARMTPLGAHTEFPLPTSSASSYSMVAGPDGNLWFTEADSGRIGRITTSGTIAEFPLPTATEWIGSIAAGSDGNLWFTEPKLNRIGRITTSGAVTEFDLPAAGIGPGDITSGPDGNLWFLGTYPADVAGRITPNGDIQVFPIPSFFDRIVAGPDGNLWLAGYGALSRLTTSGEITQFPVEALYSSVAGLAIAPDGAFWIAVQPDGWGTPGQVVRLILPDTSACVANETTLCLNGGRFRVTADWRAANGSNGHGRAVNLTANSGYFWFFDPANIELIVKILNGCSSNQHQWAFAAGLTNVEVTTTVRDTQTGTTQTYTNPLGTPFAPVQDTSAFATCP